MPHHDEQFLCEDLFICLFDFSIDALAFAFLEEESCIGQILIAKQVFLYSSHHFFIGSIKQVVFRQTFVGTIWILNITIIILSLLSYLLFTMKILLLLSLLYLAITKMSKNDWITLGKVNKEAEECKPFGLRINWGK